MINGVFKIDAAALLVGKKSMMNPTGGKVANLHNHGDRDKSKKDLSEMKMNREVTVDKSKVPAKFKKQLGDVVDKYLLLKDKFANDNSAIQSDVKTIQIALKNVDMSLVMEDAHKYMDERVQIIGQRFEAFI